MNEKKILNSIFHINFRCKCVLDRAYMGCGLLTKLSAMLPHFFETKELNNYLVLNELSYIPSDVFFHSKEVTRL